MSEQTAREAYLAWAETQPVDQHLGAYDGWLAAWAACEARITELEQRIAEMKDDAQQAGWERSERD